MSISKKRITQKDETKTEGERGEEGEEKRGEQGEQGRERESAEKLWGCRRAWAPISDSSRVAEGAGGEVIPVHRPCPGGGA